MAAVGARDKSHPVAATLAALMHASAGREGVAQARWPGNLRGMGGGASPGQAGLEVVPLSSEGP